MVVTITNSAAATTAKTDPSYQAIVASGLHQRGSTSMYSIGPVDPIQAPFYLHPSNWFKKIDLLNQGIHASADVVDYRFSFIYIGFHLPFLLKY